MFVDHCCLTHKTSKTTTKSTTNIMLLKWFLSGALLSCAWFLVKDTTIRDSLEGTGLWILASCLPFSWSWSRSLHQRAWKIWERRPTNIANETNGINLTISTVDVQQFTRDNILDHLKQSFGPDWRRRPLLLQNLWTKEQLQDPSRHLSLQGLLQEDTIIDYFSDARSTRALVPDARGRVRDIVRNMTTADMPHKIGSQIIVDAHPQWISEVAPDILTNMFGDRFQPHHVQSFLLPPMTTVPVFVAPSLVPPTNKDKDNSTTTDTTQSPHTFLHCEPIGNVAVQLSGAKAWKLVDPRYSHLLRPALAPDGRAFVASYQASVQNVPHYSVVTRAGDALWVPTWTWHHVEYSPTDDSLTQALAIGASLFHFRPLDYMFNNPLFATFVVPAIVREILGLQRQ